jgi:hypothetical protein
VVFGGAYWELSIKEFIKGQDIHLFIPLLTFCKNKIRSITLLLSLPRLSQSHHHHHQFITQIFTCSILMVYLKFQSNHHNYHSLSFPRAPSRSLSLSLSIHLQRKLCMCLWNLLWVTYSKFSWLKHGKGSWFSLFYKINS